MFSRLAPIENMWSKIKSYLRQLSARCDKTFKEAIKIAFTAIQKADLFGWYLATGSIKI